LGSGRIPDIKKGRIIRPDIRPAGYPVHPYSANYAKIQFTVDLQLPACAITVNNDTRPSSCNKRDTQNQSVSIGFVLYSTSTGTGPLAIGFVIY
jgi:hypothetical protein